MAPEKSRPQDGFTSTEKQVSELSVTRSQSTQRGSAMIVAMVSLVGLIGVGGVALLAAQGGLSGTAHDRFQSAALHAAEAGVAVAMDALRTAHDATERWSSLVTPENQDVALSSIVAGNGAHPGDENNLFSSDRQSWYEVEIHNNVSDSGYADGQDEDSRVIIRATGHGPDGSTVILEVEVSGQSLVIDDTTVCAGYGQRGLDADGSGRDDCMGVVDSGSTASFEPES
jgi:Tfp pilus assembly protein PilX